MAPNLSHPIAWQTGKNDAADAIAICDQPGMRFVPVKDPSAGNGACIGQGRDLSRKERQRITVFGVWYPNLGLSPHKALMLYVILFLTRGNSASTGQALH
jgi:hypothetical protein